MKSRLWVLVSCAAVLATVVLLATTMENLRFAPARPLSVSFDFVRPLFFSGLRIDESTSVWEILFFWLVLVIPALLVILLLPPELRKRVLQQVVRFALFMLGLVLALRYRLINLPELETSELLAGQSSYQTFGDTPQNEAFVAPVLPVWVTFLISLLLVMLLTLGLYLTYRYWRRTRERKHLPLAEIGAIAKNSLNDLDEGRQWGDVVVEAYARMTDAVRVSYGMHRQASWTPREFASRLGRRGLPASSIDELTRLFEAARYGAAVADGAARRRAASCLESILQACGAAM